MKKPVMLTQFLDGGIDIFINAYLKWIALAKKKE